jgi:signal transduction histidine kinase/CheY-like chemotaxis protein
VGRSIAESPIQRTMSSFAKLSSALAVAVSVVVSCGWIFERAALRSLFPGLPEMKFNAALGFLLAGTSLWLLTGRGRLRGIAAQACAITVALVGALTLIEYAFGWGSRIDELLIPDRTADSPHPGRIPIAGAVNFLLLGAMLSLPDRQTARERWLSESLAIIVVLVSFVVILGYAFDVSSLYRTRSSGPVALHGVILFMLLALGALFARPDHGLMQRVLAADAGGVLIRRLLPAAILIPPLIAWLRLQGEQAGLYDENLGVAIYTTATVVIFSILIWSTAAVVRRADAERRAAELKLHAQVIRLDLLNQITGAIGERQDLHSIFQVVVRSLEEHLPVDFGCIATHDSTTAMLTVEAVGARSATLAAALALPKHASIPVDGNGLARCIRGALVYEPDTDPVPFPFPQRLARTGLRALVITPLLIEGQAFGVLIAARREAHSFSSGDCEFLRQLSAHVALVTHQGQLYQALQAAYDDLRHTQQSLVQQERLRALGQMASGIAHDINNALSPIALYTESLLERESQLSVRGREQLSTIQRAIDDIAHTVSRMREFYRPRETQAHLAPIDLNALVKQVVELTRARWWDLPQQRGAVIDLRTELATPLPRILGAEWEIRDALTNLIFNGIDAMLDGGTLALRTRVHCDHESDNPREPMPPATHVLVEVSDTGTGMDEETRRRCLEPFFTTKGERGTGLGLAMVYGMTQRHSAEFEIDSSVGKGTTIRLVFPVALAEHASPADASPSLVPLRPLRILVIDDDPLLIHSLRDALVGDGHAVTVADGGQAGIDSFLAAQTRGEPFAVVVTDLGMPYVDGRKVAAAVAAAGPTTPVILLTGWGQRLSIENDIPAHVNLVLSKPPRLHELRAALAEVTANTVAPKRSGQAG